MSYKALRQKVLGSPIKNHSARLWRVAENVQANLIKAPSDDRLLHAMSRVGELSRGLAQDLRDGQLTPEQVATLLDQLADLGELSFDRWMHSK